MLVDSVASIMNSENLVPESEIAQFREQGYVLPTAHLPADAAAEMRDAIDQIIVDNPDWHGILRMPHVPIREGQLEGLIGGEKIFKIAMHPVLIAVARRLVGPDLILWGGEIFAKPSGTGARTPWHQDCYTPAVKAGPGRKYPESAMIWIAVDDVDPTNGSLSFIPYSGRNGPIEHGKFNRTVKELLNFEADTSALDVGGAVHSVLKSGQFSVHDFHVVHGASANTSGRRRIGLTLHYMSARDVYDRSFGDAIGSGRSQPAPIARRPIWLVLGENQVEQNDFIIGHQNLEDLDQMAEETRRRLTPLLS